MSLISGSLLRFRKGRLIIIETFLFSQQPQIIYITHKLAYKLRDAFRMQMLRCSSDLVRVKEQRMQFLLYVKSKKNSLANRSCGWLLWTWRRLSIGYRVRYYGGLRYVGVEKWIVNVIKSMYDGVTTSVKMNGVE